MMTGTPEYGRTRAGATLALMRNDFVEGIEGKDMISDTICGVRNALVAGWHGIQGVIPSIANGFNGQRYSVVPREGPLQGTTNSVKKIVQTKGVVGKASAVLAEATDGPVDDVIHAVSGGAKWMVVPEK